MISRKIYHLTEKIARNLPSPLVALLGMPINYLDASRDVFAFENTRMINTAFGICMNNKVQGDYAEFGVFVGKTTIEAYRSSRRTGFNDMRFFIYDSFEGLPEVRGIDDNGSFSTGEYACTRADFENNLKKANCDLSLFEMVEGFFDKTLPAHQGAERIAIAWIDCDLYESTVPVLEYLTDRLVHGAILIFDDWFCYHGAKDRGEQLACAEWLAKNPQIELVEYQNFHWAGKSFMVNRR